MPEADPGAGEVRVRSTVVGICGSDMHAACGRHPFIDLPYRPGHEVIGVVDARRRRTSTTPGWAPASSSNPTWPAALHAVSSPAATTSAANSLVLGCQTPGGLADSFTVAVDRVIALNPELDDDHAILIEPLATPIHAVRRAAETVGDLPRRSVVVIGAGPIGLFVAARRPRRRRAGWSSPTCWPPNGNLAERLGADGSFDPTAADAVDRRTSAARRYPPPSSSTAWPGRARWSQAIDLVDKGGAIMIVGVAAGAIPVRLDLIQDRELALIGNLMYVREDYAARHRAAARQDLRHQRPGHRPLRHHRRRPGLPRLRQPRARQGPRHRRRTRHLTTHRSAPHIPRPHPGTRHQGAFNP